MSPQKRARIVEKDHSYKWPKTPEELNKKKKRKVWNFNRKLKRRNKKIKNMNDLINELKKHNKITIDAGDILSQEFSGLSLEIIKNIQMNQKHQAKRHRYSNRLKQFAVTLFYHSPKAYE